MSNIKKLVEFIFLLDIIFFKHAVSFWTIIVNINKLEGP